MTGVRRIPPLLVTAAGAPAALLAGLLAGCTADDPAPLPTTPPSPTTATAGRINIQYFGDDGSTGLVFVEAGGAVLGKTMAGQTTCTLDAAAYRVLTTAAAAITAKDHAAPQPGAGDTTSTPTLGTEVGAVSLLDPRVVSAADTVNQLIADVAAEPASRTVCT
jgi:hypothetical protein